MPGANCSIFGCSTSRKTKGISIFRVPTGDDDYNRNWREKITNIVTRDRELDKSLRNQIANRSLYTCELHYTENQLVRNDSRTTRVPGALPCINLPIKSIPKANVPERSSSSIEKRQQFSSTCSVTASSSAQASIYKSFSEFYTRIMSLKLGIGWGISKMSDNLIQISFHDTEYIVPKYEIYVDQSLNYKIRVFTWLLPENHDLIKSNSGNMENITLSNLVASFSNFNLCKGLSETFHQDKTKTCITHIIPKMFKMSQQTDESPLSQAEYYRSYKCQILCEQNKCKTCCSTEKYLERQQKLRDEKSQIPVKGNAPLSLTSPNRVATSLQFERVKNKELEAQIATLQKEINKHSLAVNKELNNDLVSIMSNAHPSKVSPFMKFFWEQQQKYIQASSSGVRYHPMIIRYCLSLAAKSPSAYDDIRYDEKNGTGFLILPSRRRLRDYKNYIRPERGFNKEIIFELKHKVEKFSESEKYMVLLFDEMKVQENLVWDKHSGELIGYVDLGDSTLNYASLQKVDEIATHILVFMLRSIVNPFKFSLANFATTGATSSQIFALFWRAVSICELQCELKIIAATCDGASPNRKFFRMHFDMTSEDDANPEVDVTYRTDNLFADEKRFIYFISDPPHLIKTARNCLSNSGAGRYTRVMWNSGELILWNHISERFYEDQNCGLNLLPKLTNDHIKLTPYSIMNVRLAAQVLSDSVSKVLSLYGPPEAAATSKFCYMMDNFFDIVNVRNLDEHTEKLKPFLAPFESVNDIRFSWLQNVFLQYFIDWQNSIEQRPGNFNKTAQGSMFISWQTHEGLKITVNSIIECCKFLLNNKVCSYVLTERFCQDPLENYFGRQRSLGFRRDGVSVAQVGYNDNTIRNAKIFRPISAGNVGDQAQVEICDDPLPCRKKPKKD